MKKIPVLILLAILALAAGAADLDRFLVRCYILQGDYELTDSVRVAYVMKNDTVPVDFKLLNSYPGTNMIKGSELRLMVNSGLGNYVVRLEKEGFEPVDQKIKIASVSEEMNYIPAVTLKPARQRKLDEVTVTATRVKMVMKGDTMVFDAGAFNLDEGSMLDALVRQLPGATIDGDGVITVNGRKINELLVNGKDFFKGDPKVALSNLPSYTVKNIKVYDKAADDAYLTKSNAKWVRNEEEENLVMDVNLKREYNNGWTANVEAGGGTESRYRMRGFVLGYNDYLRISAYGNVNNVGESDLTSGMGWTSMTVASAHQGIQTIKKGGLDYNYDNKKKIKLDGRISGGTESTDIEAFSSATNVYPSRNLFVRSKTDNDRRYNSLVTNHTLRISGENVFFTFIPRLSWSVRNGSIRNLKATFTSNPEETFRGEALDSLFARGTSSRYYRSLLTRLYDVTASHSTSLDASFNMGLTYRPKQMKGVFSIGSYGSYSYNPSKSRNIFLQHLGPDAAPGQVPVMTDRFTDRSDKNRSLSVNARYSYTKNVYTTNRMNSLQSSVTANYRHNNTRGLTSLLKADADAGYEGLPSVVSPEGAVRDFENSYNSRTLNNNVQGLVSLSFTSQPLAPGDSTFNGSYGVTLELTNSFNHERLIYEKPTIMEEQLHRTTNFLSPSLSFNLSSQNRLRMLSVYLSMSMNKTAPPLLRLINTTDSSDPLNIYLGAPADLKNATFYSIFGSFGRYSRTDTHARFSISLRGNIVRDQLAMARTYNPETGVSIHYPTTINGNWSLTNNIDYAIQIGPRNQVELHAFCNTTYNNSADFTAIDTEPVKSVVRNWNVSPNLGVGYRFKNGGTVSMGAGITWNTASSHREGFYGLNSRAYDANIMANLKLPAKLTLDTKLLMTLLRGYTDKSMNTSSWIWNASLSRPFLKGDALTLKLSGFDILNSVKRIVTTVNAQGRTETWSNSLPRYIMLTVAYRIDMKPKNR